MNLINCLTLNDFDLAHKKVLLRADLNVPLTKDGEVASPYRLTSLLPTIEKLRESGAKTIIISHLGRPTPHEPAQSLGVIGKTLATLLKHPVTFVPEITGEAVQRAIDAMRDGDVLLLENLRRDPREERNDPQFAAELAALADIYLNDAFSVSHRSHASVARITELLPSGAGLLLEKELDALAAVLQNPARPVVAIIGGSKISTKLALIENILAKVDTLMVGGAMANTFLAAEGVNVQTSRAEPELIPLANHILRQAHGQHGCHLMLPYDTIVAPSPDSEIGVAAPALGIPDGQMILDIGPATLSRIEATLAEARTVLWNGPVGLFEAPAFANGTRLIAEMIAHFTAKNGLVSIAGGGDTVAALEEFGLEESFTYVSTAGGAFLELLEGRELPGIVALQKAAERLRA